MSTFRAGQVVNIKEGATEFLKGHGFHEPEYMSDNVDAMTVTVLEDLSYLDGIYSHYEVKTQAGSTFGVHPDYLEQRD